MILLTTLPGRPHGVLTTIEFILSVHPSNANTVSVDTPGRSSISHEAMQEVTKVLCALPLGWTAKRWFKLIGPQLLTILEDDSEPELKKVAAFIIGFGILGRQSYGARGMPGWNSFAVPYLQVIDPTLGPAKSPSKPVEGDDEIIDLAHKLSGTDLNIIWDSAAIANSLASLTTLLTLHPNPSLAGRLLRPILLPLWSLSSWPGGNEETHCRPARKLLQMVLQLSCGPRPLGQKLASNDLQEIVAHLMFNGRHTSYRSVWTYSSAENGGICIIEPDNNNLVSRSTIPA
jgi:hypothetical protein